MARLAPLFLFVASAVLLASCFTAPLHDADACARLARRLCECGPAACAAAPPLLAAAERLEGRASRNGALACRAELATTTRCSKPGGGP